MLATDLQTGVDCRDLPYADGEIDCVVLDPPYMEGLYRRSQTHMAGSGSHGAFRSSYSDGLPTTGFTCGTYSTPSCPQSPWLPTNTGESDALQILIESTKLATEPNPPQPPQPLTGAPVR